MRAITLSLLMLAAAFSLSVSAAPDAERWYIEDYASLWAGKPGDNIDAMLAHYADKVITHEDDGEISVIPKQAWLAEPMAEWLAEGWLEAKLKKVETDQLNASTVSFKAIWVDRYDGAPDEMSCGWYLADLIDGRWQFTAYADIDCAAHGLQ